MVISENIVVQPAKNHNQYSKDTEKLRELIIYDLKAISSTSRHHRELTLRNHYRKKPFLYLFLLQKFNSPSAEEKRVPFKDENLKLTSCVLIIGIISYFL